MAVIDKQIFTSWNSSGDVQNLYDFLEEKGFYRSNMEILLE